MFSPQAVRRRPSPLETPSADARLALAYAAGAWTNTSNTDVTGADERNTGELTLTNGTNMYVQVGLAYSSSTAAFAQADVSVSVGARRN